MAAINPIKIDPNGATVFCAVASNPLTVTRYTLVRFDLPDGASQKRIKNNARPDPKARIELGEPSDWIGKAVLQCAADVARNPASGDSTWRLALRFYQGSSKVGEVELNGDFGADKLVAPEINCRLTKQ